MRRGWIRRMAASTRHPAPTTGVDPSMGGAGGGAGRETARRAAEEPSARANSAGRRRDGEPEGARPPPQPAPPWLGAMRYGQAAVVWPCVRHR